MSTRRFWTGLVVEPEDVQPILDATEVRVSDTDDGHRCVIKFAGVTIQGEVDGTRTLVDLLQGLATVAEDVHAEWLRSKVTEQAHEPIIGIHGSENGRPKQPSGPVLACIRPDRHGPDDHGPSCWVSEAKAAEQ